MFVKQLFYQRKVIDDLFSVWIFSQYYPATWLKSERNMEINLPITRLGQWRLNSSLPYGMMFCEILNAFVQIGDFLIVSQPTREDVIGKLIDISKLEDICVDEVSLEDENYFFLDNGSEEKRYVY